jgi:hypothetical protein
VVAQHCAEFLFFAICDSFAFGKRCPSLKVHFPQGRGRWRARRPGPAFDLRWSAPHICRDPN